MIGPNETSGYTLSLFDLADGTGTRTWADLLRALNATKAAWRRELDSHFLKALHQQLFLPIESRMLAGGAGRGHDRSYRPLLYSIVHGPTVRSASSSHPHADRRPRTLTIVLVPELAASPETGND